MDKVFSQIPVFLLGISKSRTPEIQEASKFAVFLTLLGLAWDTSYGYGK